MTELNSLQETEQQLLVLYEAMCASREKLQKIIDANSQANNSDLKIAVLFYNMDIELCNNVCNFLKTRLQCAQIGENFEELYIKNEK